MNFDREKPIVATGVVNTVKWENPHTLITIDVKIESGKVEQWTFESFPPVLYRKGLRLDRLKPGAEVTMNVPRARWFQFRSRQRGRIPGWEVVLCPVPGCFRSGG